MKMLIRQIGAKLHKRFDRKLKLWASLFTLSKHRLLSVIALVQVATDHRHAAHSIDGSIASHHDSRFSTAATILVMIPNMAKWPKMIGHSQRYAYVGVDRQVAIQNSNISENLHPIFNLFYFINIKSMLPQKETNRNIERLRYSIYFLLLIGQKKIFLLTNYSALLSKFDEKTNIAHEIFQRFLLSRSVFCPSLTCARSFCPHFILHAKYSVHNASVLLLHRNWLTLAYSHSPMP